MTAMVGAARGDMKEEWELDSVATLHMPHVRTGMSDYKKAFPETTVDIANGNVLPLDGFGRIEVDLGQPRHTTKMVKIDEVAYLPGLSQNPLSALKAEGQWAQRLFWGSWGSSRFFSTFITVGDCLQLQV